MGFEYKSPTSSESGLTLVGQGDYPNEEPVKVTSPIKGLNEPSREPDIDEDGNKAQNMKGRWKKLAQAQPKSNATDMEIIKKLTGTKRSLWTEEDTSKEGGQKKLRTGESTTLDLMAMAARQHRREP